MKPNNPQDPLDRRINALLASRPLRPSRDFTRRVLRATDPQARKHPRARILQFVWPLAAALAVALPLLQILPTRPKAPPTDALSQRAAQEIFFLEEGLSAFAPLQPNEVLNTEDLLSSLDTLVFEIES